MVVGRLLSYWEGNFPGAMLSSVGFLSDLFMNLNFQITSSKKSSKNPSMVPLFPKHHGHDLGLELHFQHMDDI